jgi:hypothetical protein
MRFAVYMLAIFLAPSCAASHLESDRARACHETIDAEVTRVLPIVDHPKIGKGSLPRVRGASVTIYPNLGHSLKCDHLAEIASCPLATDSANVSAREVQGACVIAITSDDPSDAREILKRAELLLPIHSAN